MSAQMVAASSSTATNMQALEIEATGPAAGEEEETIALANEVSAVPKNKEKVMFVRSSTAEVVNQDPEQAKIVNPDEIELDDDDDNDNEEDEENEDGPPAKKTKGKYCAFNFVIGLKDFNSNVSSVFTAIHLEQLQVPSAVFGGLRKDDDDSD